MAVAVSSVGNVSTPRPNSYPSWIDTAIANGWIENTWCTIAGASPTHSLSATNTCYAVAPSDHASRGDQSGVMKAWCGGAFAKLLGTFGSFITMGGGHGDYQGNEVYRFDVDTRTWTRLSDPYPTDGDFTGLTTGWWPADGAQVNGSPASIHTNQMVLCHPRRNSFWTFFGQTDSGSANANPLAGEFCLSTNIWSQRGTNPGTTALEGFSAYDSRRDVFFYHGGGSTHLFTHNVVSDTYTEYNPSNDSVLQISYSVADYDYNNDMIAVVNPNDSNLYGITPSAPATTVVNLTTSGKPTITGQGGFGWSASLDAFYWHNGTSTDVYRVKKGYGPWQSATYTWTSMTSGSNAVTPESNEANGVFSKFQVIDYIGCTIAIMVRRTGLTGAGAVYAFLLKAPS